MPHVLPLVGLRYAASSADLPDLISPPYDVIAPREAAELRALSPHNVVHLELPLDVDGQPGSGYTAAGERARQWRTDGTLRRANRPAYYLSETRFAYAGRHLVRRDLLASIGAEPWSSGAVLPHEHTMSGPKADRLELLRATHLNISPIWVLSREHQAPLEAAWQQVGDQAPLAEFAWRGEDHRMWAIDAPDQVAALARAFAEGGPLYIADGHHRYETNLAFRSDVAASVPGASGILATVTWADEPGLIVLPTHRLLHGLDGHTRADLIGDRESLFEIRHLDATAGLDTWLHALADHGQRTPTIALYGFGDLDRLTLLSLRSDAAVTARLPSDRSDAWRSLDVSILHSLLLDPLLAASGRPRDEALSFERDPAVAIDAVRAGTASATILLNPTPVTGVLDVADAGDRMPEKSTYFWPKPPTGLVLRDLDLPA